jgi:hypothetical protein
MLLLPEGQMGEAWELRKKQCPFLNLGAFNTKVLSQLILSNRDLISKCADVITKEAACSDLDHPR